MCVFGGGAGHLLSQALVVVVLKKKVGASKPNPALFPAVLCLHPWRQQRQVGVLASAPMGGAGRARVQAGPAAAILPAGSRGRCGPGRSFWGRCSCRFPGTNRALETSGSGRGCPGVSGGPSAGLPAPDRSHSCSAALLLFSLICQAFFFSSLFGLKKKQQQINGGCGAAQGWSPRCYMREGGLASS